MSMVLEYQTISPFLSSGIVVYVLVLIQATRITLFYLKGECGYEQQLLPYLHREDTDIKRQKKQKAPTMCGKNNKSKPKPSDSSRFELEYIDEEAEMETAPLAGFDSTSALVKQRLPHEHLTEGPPGDDLRPVQVDSPSHNFDNNFAIVSIREKDQTFRDPSYPDDVPELNAKNEEDADLQEMFYLPKTYSTTLSHSDTPRRHESLKPILANVAELLSRSPPSLENMLEVETAAPCLPSSPQLRLQPFPISFSLDVDDDDDDDGCDDISAAGRDSDEPVVLKGGSKHREPDSPTWDAVFKDEDVSYENIRDDKKELDSKKSHDPKECVCMENERWDNIRADAEPSTRDAGVMEDGGISNNVQINESMDLFEDDEAFMQMTIPDIPTPEDSVTAETTLNAKHNESSDKMAKSEHTSSTRNPSDCTEILNAAKITQQVGEDNRTPASDARLKLQGSNTRTEGKPQFQKPVDHFTKDDSSFQSLVQENPEPLDSSLNFFSVNFDLGYLLEDSEDETEVEAAPASPSTKKQAESAVTLPAVSNSSTPRSSFAGLFRESKLSPPQIETDYWKSRTEELPSPVTSLGARRTLLSRLVEPPSSSLKWRRTEGNLRVASAEDSSQQGSVHVGDSSPNPGQKARQFLDEEAELSEDEEGADVSSDEEDGADLNRSLEGFVVDNTHLSQGLNGNLLSL
ncbi:hypothetical protein GOODEAATRI_006405 [Goodea atripinnis]|uniref:Uncharacterized protein n=1 Tax=Goodea atripinnis TaxID=208336 RepID=A0ABV0NI04_9TELE